MGPCTVFYYSHLCFYVCRYPSAKILSQLCFEHLQWTRFKSRAVEDVLDYANGLSVATKPEIRKGVCRWMDNSAETMEDGDDRYKDCLTSKTPIYQHHKRTVLGHCNSHCILSYTPPRSGSGCRTEPVV